jgi:crotonobetainyl-CoA:carnitine CoA-transferase CaiB-like acyl-CoA transferase
VVDKGSQVTQPDKVEDAALRGIAVVDLTSSVAGQFCSRLFADNGATVALVEPEGGHRLRAAHPVVTAPDGTTCSTLFWHLALGKRSVRGDATGVSALIADADVVVVDDNHVLPEPTSGSQVVICITPFGDGNEFSGWRGEELVYQALSGTMHENGDPGAEPLYGVGHRASYAAGTAAYVTALATFYGAGPGRHVVDVAIEEVAASMNFCRVAHYSYNGSELGRDAKETQRAVVKVKDGYLGLFANESRWAATCTALGVDDLITDPRFARHEDRRENWTSFRLILEERLADRAVDELLELGQGARAVVARSMPLTDLRDSAQLVERGFWDDADTGVLPQLGPMFAFSETPQVRGRVAPELGEADPTALLHRERWDIASRAADPGAPLSGVRVLDLSSAWAGPMAARFLGALGADVLKVEGPGRIDDWRGAARGGDHDRYPDLERGARPYDRHFQYNTQNQDKRGIVLDLKSPEGKDLALRLAATHDIVMANFSTGALDRMGLGWEVLRRVNPEAVLLEMPAYGSTGPMARWIAYGPSMELMAGIAGLIGYGDGRPTVTGPAYNDPIGGLHGAAALVTALLARERTHRGQHVEVAQRDAAMHWIGEEIIAALVTKTQPVPEGNARADASPHRAYRTAGDDEWVAVAAFTDGEFVRLWETVGGDPTRIPALSSLAERRAAAEEIDAAISRWVIGRDKHRAAQALQAAGVPAAAVLKAGDLARSDYLVVRGIVQRIEHREAGTHLYPILPVHIDGIEHRVRRPAPCFGEHNEEILGGELGLTGAQLADLSQRGVIADVPTSAR